MSLDFANSNVNRNITLAGTSVAIFTFLLFFLYPRYELGKIDPILFQFTLGVVVSVIFSLVFSATYYYATTLGLLIEKEHPAMFFGRADGFWVLGYSLLLLEPSLILFTVSLPYVAVYALILWFAYLYLTLVQFLKLQPKKR